MEFSRDIFICYGYIGEKIMKKIKNYLLLLAFIISLVCGLFAVNSTEVFAESSYLPVERYTESDNLLKEDGTESSKTIRSFAAEVKAGKSIYYPELAEVIPRQYLESQDENATFAY